MFRTKENKEPLAEEKLCQWMKFTMIWLTYWGTFRMRVCLSANVEELNSIRGKILTLWQFHDIALYETVKLSKWIRRQNTSAENECKYNLWKRYEFNITLRNEKTEKQFLKGMSLPFYIYWKLSFVKKVSFDKEKTFTLCFIKAKI